MRNRAYSTPAAQAATKAPASAAPTLGRKLGDYAQLVKLRLSLTVVFSSSMAYLILRHGAIVWADFLMLSLGGFLVTAAANAVNETLEKRFDAQMRRTANRPLAAGRMKDTESLIFAGLSLALGLAILFLKFTPLTGGFAALSFLLYAFVYTPLKRVSPLSVWVGAVPGALPPMIGAVAAGGFSQAAGLLFAIQFCWQFPHFWSIAWLGYEDYAKAGYRMVVRPPGKRLAALILASAFALLPLGALPYFLGHAGLGAVFVSSFAWVLIFIPAVLLFLRRDRRSALRVMFASFVYIPIVWTGLLLFQG